MLIHEARSIVDFFVDDEVEVLFTHTKRILRISRIPCESAISTLHPP